MKILLIGCGGIGSWFCHFLAFGVRNNTINCKVTIADGDIVETKNLLYSNFDLMDAGKNKAEVLAERYNFSCIANQVQDQEDLKKFDLVVIATDDGKSRKMVFESGVDWIDMRAKGSTFAVFVKGCKNDEEMIKALDLDRERESCQDEHRLRVKKVDNGNIIAASLGYQFLLNYLRKEIFVKEYRGCL
jgi:saccharopine dehydrogenase-like NADP-dependent oxidoreductase